MATPLPVTKAAYARRVNSSHDYEILVDVLTMEERHLHDAVLIDGQINIQRDSTVRRTATLTLFDPDARLGLDTGDTGSAAMFANKMIRVRHRVYVGATPVTVTCMVGPVSQVSRTGVLLDVEVQDKAALAMLGTRPYTVPKGMNAATAIRRIMMNVTGERRLRVANTNYRLPRAVSTGWSDEASALAAVSQISRMVGWRVYYSADGYFTAGPRSSVIAWRFDDSNTVGEVTGATTFSDVVNYARVTSSDQKQTVVKVAQAAVKDPLSAYSLGRNGAPRFMPSLAEVTGVGSVPVRPKVRKGRKLTAKQKRRYAQSMVQYRASVRSTSAKAAASARSLLNAGLSVEAETTASVIPVFHLDVSDRIQIVTESGPKTLTFDSGSIPLVSGEMSIGAYRRVSRPPVRRAVA